MTPPGPPQNRAGASQLLILVPAVPPHGSAAKRCDGQTRSQPVPCLQGPPGFSLSRPKILREARASSLPTSPDFFLPLEAGRGSGASLVVQLWNKAPHALLSCLGCLWGAGPPKKPWGATDVPYPQPWCCPRQEESCGAAWAGRYRCGTPPFAAIKFILYLFCPNLWQKPCPAPQPGKQR